MKKAIAKQSLRLLAAVFVLLSALAFTATQVNAQSGGDLPLNQTQTLNWYSETESMGILDAQLIVLGNDLQNLTPGTATYNDVLNHLSYYKLIYTDLEDGASVQQATVDNIYRLKDLHSAKESDGLSDAKLMQLYSDAVALLTY